MLIARNSAKVNIRVNKGPVKQIFEKSINNAISESELSIKVAAKFAPKYKNVAKTLYKTKTKFQKTSCQIKYKTLISMES